MSTGERVALVVAPPGYGKTVAVRQWVAADGPPAGWFSLDLLDGNPASFWLHLIRALRAVLSGLDDEPELLLAERGPRDPLFLAVLIAEIERDGVHRVIVLDDVSHVTDRSVLDGIALMVDRVGHLLRFVIVGRSDPALPVARWRSAGWLGEVREEHLRYTDTEALAAAATFADLELTDDAVMALNRRTEGWPAGLHLALLSIRSSPDPDGSAREVAGSDRLLADYLAAEVLDQLPEKEREVALSLSVLDWFDPDLCRDLIGNDAVPLARQLQRRRLFLTTIDEHDGAMRFHSLFRELLESELRWRDPERRVALHRRAATLWTERGDLNAAYRHLVRIGDGESARDLVVQPILELVDRGDRRGLAQHMRSFPREMQVDNASLAFDLATAWFFAGNDREATIWCDRAQGLMSTDDPATQVRLHSTRCMLALMHGDLPLAAEHVEGYERLVSHIGTANHIEVRFATIALRVALASRRFDRARMWVERAREITDPGPVASVTVPALVAWLELELGDLAHATTLADDACAKAEEIGMRPHHGAFDALVVAAWCHVAGGDLTVADRLAECARIDAETLGFPWNRVRAGVVVAEIRRLAAGPRSSLEAVRHLRFSVGRETAGHLAGDLDVVEARGLIGCGEDHTARQVIQTLDDGPRRSLLLARLAARSESGHFVEQLLGERQEWTVAEQLEAEVLISSASEGSMAEARLSEALAKGAITGWVSPFLGHCDAVDQLLQRLPVERLHPVLAGVLHPTSSPALAECALIEPLTPRELTVLMLLPTHLSYAQIGERLYLSINTVKSNLKIIYRKLGVGSRSAAVDAAIRAGLV